jgi:hypothetical protein
MFRLILEDLQILRGGAGLENVDVSPLWNVTRISGSFLCDPHLRRIDLSPFSNVTEISGDFLSGCTGLTELDLSPLWTLGCSTST